jgi:hypothetical protein
MMNNRKLPGGALLIAGAAAFAWYKYSKMSQEEKSKLTTDLKEKGQKLYDQYMPEEVKSMFANKTGGSSATGSSAATGGPSSASSRFGEGNDYSS